MGTRRRDYRRSNLYLVRLWCAASDDGGNEGKDRSQVTWRGKVQRIVDGEAQEFRSLPGLVDSLLARLVNNKERG